MNVMTNIEFLNYINVKIVKHINTNEYFAYVGAIYGYDEEHNYDNGMMFKINSDLLNDVYSIEEIVKSKESSEYIYEPTLAEINDGLFNTYKPITEIDLQLYKLKNDINTYQYTEYELNNFTLSFMRLIQTYGNFANDNMNTTKNQIYKRVIDFYANGQYDETLTNLTLLLKSENYKYTETSTMSMCGCSNSPSIKNGLLSTDDDCPTVYQNAMFLYLKQMFADLDFYYDFFHTEGEPIEDLIDNLIRLIEEFKTLGHDLSFSINKSHCDCSQLTKDNGSCNYNILDNYIRVLNWIKNCEIEENANKIKIYGEQFAELLPKLQF